MKYGIAVSRAALLLLGILSVWRPGGTICEEKLVIDRPKTIEYLRGHLTELTSAIGDRSVRRPGNLEKAAAYIQDCFERLDLAVERQTYRYHDTDVSNVVARLELSANPSVHYVVGAHYDSVAGTVGADDNASAVAVLLETARTVNSQARGENRNLAISFVAFALEESPTYGTRFMGSRVFAVSARKQAMPIDGMICLEMVGYTCHDAGCQRYPFPLQFFGYPKRGDFIGIVGNVKSRGFTHRLRRSFERNPDLPVVAVTVPFNGWPMPNVRLSDHASFWNAGYRAVMVTDTAFYRNPYYHLPTDTMETLDYDFMAELVQSLALFFGAP